MKRSNFALMHALCIVLSSGAALPCFAQHAASAMDADSRAPLHDVDMDAALTAEARRVMRNLAPLPGQRLGGAVRATMDLATRSITVHFSHDFLPAEAGGHFEDQLDHFRHAMMEVSRPFLDASRVKYLYDGKDLYFYFPAIKAEDDAARKARTSRVGGGAAMVSAGHGYYHRLVKDVWVAQRSEANGVLEDLITPLYAEELKYWIENRSQMPVYRPRTTSAAVHQASGKAWWQMAGRYHLEAQYPGHPEIWNSLGAGLADDRH